MQVSRSLKSIALALSALLLCGMFLVIAPSVAQARDYTFDEGDVFQSVGIFGVKKGKVSYSKKTHTLTLKNTTITTTGGYTPIFCSLPKLKIKLVGTNKLKSGDFSAITCNGSDLTILGKGKLYVTVRKSGEAGIEVFASSTTGKRGNFYLKSGTVKVTKGTPGISCKSAKVYGGTLKLVKCASGIACVEWNGSKKATVKHKGGSFTMTGGKTIITKVKAFGVNASSVKIGKKAKVSVTGGDSSATGLLAKSSEHKYAGKTYTWGGTSKIYGTVTGRNVSTTVSAYRTVTNKGTIDGTGNSTSAVSCTKLVNYGTIKGAGCGFSACDAQLITGTGKVIG